jgi:hypothetical protein
MSVQCIGGDRVEQVFGAGPRPLLRSAHETRGDRVREDVLERVPQMLVVADHRRGEAVAEEVSLAAVATVELLRVDAVHPLHPRRQRGELALRDEVEVRVQEAPDEDAPAPLRDLAREEREQEEAVAVVADDPGGVHAEDRHVERAPGREPAAGDAWHRRRP